MAKNIREIIKLDKIVSGGQALGQLSSGKKVFVWGGLAGETVEIETYKNKSGFAEAIVTNVLTASPLRVEPLDTDSFLSTSPWQIMDFGEEQKTKLDLVKEAFALHKTVLPENLEIYSDNQIYAYRNKMEFSFWQDFDKNLLHLAFYKRGSKFRSSLEKSSLAKDEINEAAQSVLQLLRAKNITAQELKTILIRSNQKAEIAAQLYVKNADFKSFQDDEIKNLGFKQFEIIFSDPRSPASVITKKIQSIGSNLNDKILDTTYNYSTEGFFQINLPVYNAALSEMKKWVIPNKDVVDLYSGVGSIGLSIAREAKSLKLIEISQSAISEMKRNIDELGLNNAEAILSASEKALEYISSEDLVIVDPPRAGLHEDVIDKLLEVLPERIIYLSCNPVTQARDYQKLSQKYRIEFAKSFNFFPRTPHIENLLILSKTSFD